jgi:hypothetical protein
MSNNPSWLVPPTPTHLLHTRTAPEPAASPQNPSWLIPPKPTHLIGESTQPQGAQSRPASAPSIRLQIGRKPTAEEWQWLQNALKANPELRLSIGTKHPSIPDLYFLRYHTRYINGERWGTKEELEEAKRQRRDGVKRWKANKARYDSEWKAQRDAKFKKLAERQKIRLAASKEAAEEARYGNSKRAKAYRRRRAEKEAQDAAARAERLRKRREARAKLPKIIP